MGLLSTLSLHHGLEAGMGLESTWIRSVSFAVVVVVLWFGLVWLWEAVLVW